MTHSLDRTEIIRGMTDDLISHVTFMRDQYPPKSVEKTIFRRAGVKLEQALDALEKAVDILKDMDA